MHTLFYPIAKLKGGLRLPLVRQKTSVMIEALEDASRAIGHEAGQMLASVAGAQTAGIRPAAAPGCVGRGAVFPRSPRTPSTVSATASRLVHPKEGIRFRSTGPGRATTGRSSGSKGIEPVCILCACRTAGVSPGTAVAVYAGPRHSARGAVLGLIGVTQASL